MNMLKFFVTFGQLHPLRDGYMIVEASSYENARAAVFEVLGSKWAFIQTEDTNMSMYPLGPIGRPIIGD